jgi:VWFA-related protein
LLYSVVVSAVPAEGQPPPTTHEGVTTFGDVVESRLVNVEVWVADGKGHPITGLTLADFEVREDGETVEVTHFTEIGGSTQTESVRASDPTLEPETLSPPLDDPGHLVLYFDQLHLSQSGRQQMIKDLRQFLDSGEISPERVMILSQSQNLDTVTPFGSSLEQLQAGLEFLSTVPTKGTQSAFDKRVTVKNLELMWEDEKDTPGKDPCLRYPRRALAEIEFFAFQSSQQFSTTLSLLADATGYLYAVPGVKTLVYFGDRLETTPGQDLLTFIDVLCPPYRRDGVQLQLGPSMVEPFYRLTRHANANRVTFYTVQTSGLRASFLMSADMSSSDLLVGGGRIDSALRSNEQTGLTFLSNQTGGWTVLNRNRFGDELTRISQAMSGYYSLAYSPDHGGDGREHKIKVRVREKVARSPDGELAKKVLVRHRRGYRDKDPTERMSERLQGAVHLGLVSNPLDIRLGAGTVQSRDESGFVLPLHVMVPAERIVYLPGESAPIAKLNLLMTAYNEENREVASERTIFQIERPSQLGQRTIDLVVEIDLAPGVHVVAVGLRDEATQETSYVTTAVEIQSPEQRSPETG